MEKGRMSREIRLRESRVLRKLRSGRPVLCFKSNLADARVVEIAAMCGYDCIWLCLEHVPNDLRCIEAGIWAAKAHDADVMVRVGRGSYSDHIRPLEMDASGIMVPHVMNAADAGNIVRITRFHPLGRRPVDGGNADGAFCAIEAAEYMRQANANRFVVLQIEDPEALEELDAIAAVPGYDILFFGPGDYSHGIGLPGKYDHRLVTEARNMVLDAARKHGKYAGIPATPDNVSELATMGFSFLAMGADVTTLVCECRRLVSLFEAASGGDPQSGEGDDKPRLDGGPMLV